MECRPIAYLSITIGVCIHGGGKMEKGGLVFILLVMDERVGGASDIYSQLHDDLKS